MGIRTYKPTSSGRRGGQVSDFSEITDKKKRPEKALVSRFKRRGGRNFQGKITCRHRGGGQRILYRHIDFRRNKDGVIGTVTHVEYDPNRTCRIALVQYADTWREDLTSWLRKVWQRAPRLPAAPISSRCWAIACRCV